VYDFCSLSKNIILAGDFNIDLKKEAHKRAKNEWKRFLQTFNMRETSMTNLKCNFTWSNSNTQTTIDKIYTTFKNMSYNFKYTNNIINSISDHNLLTGSLTIQKTETQSKYKKSNIWKLNISILEDEKVDTYIKNKCSYIPQMKEKHGWTWYEVFIEEIIHMLKRESIRINNDREKHIKSLYNSLMDLTLENIQENKQKINEIKNEIDKYYIFKRKGQEIRSCQMKKNFIFQPSKILIEKEIKNGKINTINKYKLQNGEITENQDIIMDEIHSYYDKLLGTKKILPEKLKNYQFKIKPLPENEKNAINYKISFEEAYECIIKMKESAPGPNGISITFFKKYFQYFGKHFIELLNNYNFPLTNTFNQVLIKLIPKNKNDIKTINDLRPISLTNFEYRIFTKILTNRLNNISHILIGENQTCSIAGRRMNDNIIFLRDIIHDAYTRKKNCR